jgi:hypothetical protein
MLKRQRKIALKNSAATHHAGDHWIFFCDLAFGVWDFAGTATYG